MAKIVIIGEAWGEQEELEQTPFVGSSGYLLTQLLAEADISRADCYLTNVFNFRPRDNKLESICGPKPLAISGYPALIKSKYLLAQYKTEIERLGDELVTVNPNLVLCLGNTASWALLGHTAISKSRGTTELSTHTAKGFKTLSTYHPAAVIRQIDLRAIVVADLMKAKREAEFPEIRRPPREIWIEPTLEDIDEYIQKFINGCEILSVDIETSGNQITCIGFAPSRRSAIVIPIADRRKTSGSYWKDAESERGIWRIIRDILEDRRIRKLFQNGLYDIAFLWRAYGIKVFGAEHDTMLCHHALQPESLKGLGFLGSIYTDEGNWKQMREKHTTIKRDD